ncbi:MAG: zinc ribbon domain-containing protein [Acidobacteria bacterium]|nr:zinc ribbon domain-containing protein [Acidobacteriota bacterium]
MFCTQCGNAVELHAKFCSKCGSEVSLFQAASGPAGKAPHDMKMHVAIVAWLFIGSGVLMGLIALTVIFAGQIVQHLPFPPPDMPAGMPGFIGWLTAMIGLGITAIGAGVAAAGIGLLQYRDWGRVLATIMSVLMLFHFPVGTAIAIYAFWVLFSAQGREYYKIRSAGTMADGGI